MEPKCPYGLIIEISISQTRLDTEEEKDNPCSRTIIGPGRSDTCTPSVMSARAPLSEAEAFNCEFSTDHTSMIRVHLQIKYDRDEGPTIEIRRICS